MFDVYVIYDHPRDHPAKFVVRRWEITVPREVVALTDTLEAARLALPAGLFCLGRFFEDDPAIAEVWV